jgi:DNA-binding transcriptional ArsR family regulator
VPTAFEVIAEPNRRQILDLLREGELPVGELVTRLRMSQPAVSKHLRVLREAGFVSPRVVAQQRHYRLEPNAFAELDEWLAHFRPFWTKTLDALQAHLDEKEH